MHLYDKEQSVMPKQITVFQDLLKYLPRKKMEAIVNKYNGNKWCKHFYCWDLLITLLQGQLSNESSLRNVNLSNQYQSNHLQQMGVKQSRRSTLSDACKIREPNIFMEMFNYLISTLKTTQKVNKELKEFVHLIDSTPIQLKGLGYEWAKSNYRITGLKVHTVYDHQLRSPVYFTMTAPNINDVTEGKKIAIQTKSIYVFDKAYYDYSWWKQIDGKGSKFVTRLKDNSPFKIKARRQVTENLLHDWTIQLSSSKAKRYDRLLRHIRVKLANKKTISLVTNDHTSSAIQIAALYKKRWEIELFFKCLKQNLQVKRFWFKNENAVKLQIIIAMIAYVLLRLAQTHAKSSLSIMQTRIVIRIKLYECNTLVRILSPPRHIQLKTGEYLGLFPGH